MFEKHLCQCPDCGSVVREPLEDGAAYTCPVCRKSFGVVLDQASGRTAFIERSAAHVPEPLYLPKGSIRALTTILIAASSWIVIFGGRDVPGYLFGLLLTIIGYYYGFRTTMKAAESWIHDVGAEIRLRIPVIPGCNDSEDNFKGIAAVAAQLPNIGPIELMPYHPLGTSKLSRLGLPDDPEQIPDTPTPEQIDSWITQLERLGVEVVNEKKATV